MTLMTMLPLRCQYMYVYILVCTLLFALALFALLSALFLFALLLFALVLSRARPKRRTHSRVRTL